MKVFLEVSTMAHIAYKARPKKRWYRNVAPGVQSLYDFVQSGAASLVLRLGFESLAAALLGVTDSKLTVHFHSPNNHMNHKIGVIYQILRISTCYIHMSHKRSQVPFNPSGSVALEFRRQFQQK